ncbi:MAG: phage tail assembly chaperone [Candidatus Devosia phytovorans]|uniref:Phage tail assembly chaperone n=1 Tax=Candidatus Devosia phytovorans TaxID=3121372 RepID=A0AAJ5VRB4_9HYPH|nr:rcc01693 family protein [Devosia sp.]WEK02776.1 MAG: phage tail assembly chaperone [Devosia sp.]
MTPFPWEAAMRFGLGVLRLPPRDFWRMSPRELAAAWGAVVGDRGAPLGRRELDMLMERFPDGR